MTSTRDTRPGLDTIRFHDNPQGPAGGALTGASPNRFDRRRHCEDETGGGPNSPRLICSDCPPVGYPTDRTRCADCPRHAAGGAA